MNIICSNILYISYKYLQENGIPYNTILSWSNKKLTTVIDDQSYIQYALIPLPSKKRLPCENDLKKDCLANEYMSSSTLFINYLQDCVKKSAQHVKKYIQDDGVSLEKAKIYSRKRAILEGLINIHNDFSTGNRLKKGYLEPIAHAYRTVAKCNTNDIEVSRIISNCKKFGIDSMIFDNRKGGNNKAFGDDYMYMLTALVSGGNNLNNIQAAKELIKLCKKEGLKAPSISWSEKKAREIEGNIDIYCAKYGLTKAKKLMPYANIINATYADDQYQIDGYNLPFFCRVFDDKGKSSINRLVLMGVKDTHSGKIVGYSIAESENRYSLYEAIYDTYSKNGGVLPYEIVSDNHSYNLTELVENFKHNADLLGMIWTVDSNPQRKAKVERGFKMLAENHLKQYHGYLGQGILTKEKNGRVSQEMVERYYSNKILSMEEVKVMVASAILEFNDTPYEGQELSPNQLYDQCTKPHRIKLDMFDEVRLFTTCKEYKVMRGQITIESKGVEYEYQLNAEQIHKYNNKMVTVRYEDFDTIYLFDKKTENPIGAIKQKKGIHGAIANQTEEDLHNLNKVEGRRKGVWSIARRELADLRDRAEEIRPGILHMMENYMIPKDVKKELENNEMLKNEVSRMGINKDRIAFVDADSHLTLTALKTPTKNKRERQPFAPKNHKIGIINLDDE